MDDILNNIGKLIRDPGVQVDLTGFVFALVVSAVVGMVVSAMYQLFFENRATGSPIHRCFHLMSPSITALFIAIQFSLPLSLGLLGALSIVRFRTPFKEPEEVGFLLLLIAGSVVCATFQFQLLVALFLLAFLVLALQKTLPRLVSSKRSDGVLLLTMSGPIAKDIKGKILGLLDDQLPKGKLECVSFTEDMTSIHYSFADLSSNNLHGLQTSLNELAPVQKLSIFFNRQGALV